MFCCCQASVHIGLGTEPDILAAAPSMPAEASVLPVSDKPVTLNFSKGIGAKPVVKAPGTSILSITGDSLYGCDFQGRYRLRWFRWGSRW
jgi:hypothetical protein